MKPSHSAALAMSSLQQSSANTQCLSPVLPQMPQAMHPRISLLPIQTSSVSTPSASRAAAASSSARFVLPFQRGLPLMSSTFTIVSSSCDLAATAARIH